MCRTVVTICPALWSLNVPHSGHYIYYQFNIQQFYVLPTHTVFMRFVWIWEQTAIISLYSIKWLDFVTEMGCVHSKSYATTRNAEHINLLVPELFF